MKKKQYKIIFLAHSNNDIDHFLPIINGLNKQTIFNPEILFLRFEEEAVSNRLHKELIKNLSVGKRSASDFLEWPFISRILFFIMKYCYIRTKGRTLKDFIRGKDIVRIFYKGVYILLDRLLKRYCEQLFTVAAINKIMQKIAPDLVLIDPQLIQLVPPFSDLRSYLSSQIVQACKYKRIPVFMVSHGVEIMYVTHKDHKIDEALVYKPDVFGLCNDKDDLGVNGIISNNVRKVILGDLRYDRRWVEILESTAKKIYNINKPIEKIIILYLVGNLRFLNDKKYEKDIHKDIISILDNYRNVELWIKMHPRVIEDIDVGVAINKDISSRIKIFRNEIDTNALIPHADIFISTFSGVLFQGIMKKKPVIFYQRWRERMDHPIKTIFDDSYYVIKAMNNEQLKESIAAILNLKHIDDEEADRFYRQAVCGGIARDGNIINNYVDEIRNIVLERANG
ncbi:MAG: CDP-glycerol glycerophosphotransferase family protein [Patescibacteria group bacterium]